MDAVVMDETIQILLARGPETRAYLDDLAGLRVRVFREWPYLYDGDPAYERDYLATYTNCPDAVIVLALAGDRVVGASTALPLAHETAEVRAPFEAAGLPVHTFFYFGESVLLPEFRGRGVGGKFMDERVAEARRTGHTRATFCAVERDEGDPRRPPGYTPLFAFWRARGFERHPELATIFHWKEIGEPAASPKPMAFWVKCLSESDHG